MNSAFGEAVVAVEVLGVGIGEIVVACVVIGAVGAFLGNTVKESSLPRVASKPPVLRPGVNVTVMDSLA